MAKSPFFKAGNTIDAGAARRRRLAKQQSAVKAGNLGGLIDALAEAVPESRRPDPRPDEMVQVPVWARDAALGAIGDLLSGRQPGTGKGRTATASARYIQDMKDLWVYREVEALRRAGLTREDAIFEATDRLAGTLLLKGGSDKTLQHAYERVTKGLKEHPARYYECKHADPVVLLAP
jgi:hypothetical protein